MRIDLPYKLAIELEKINWQKVKDADLALLIKIGLPLLERKGYLKTNVGDKESGKFSKNSNS